MNKHGRWAEVEGFVLAVLRLSELEEPIGLYTIGFVSSKGNDS